jgi:enoyl-CoA hydratase
VSSENILVEVNGGVLALTLNRPEKLNVLDLETRKSLVNAMKAHIHDDEVRCVLISSRGEAFSAGADLRYILELTPSKARAYTRFVRSVLDFVESYPKPTIAIVDGIAVGGALELLLVLDIVIASPNAKFGLTELNVGLIPGGGGSQRLPRLVGIRKAKEMVFTGSLISAEEALSLGLVNRVVAKESLMEEARRICDRIMSKNPRGLALAKRAINESMYENLAEGLRRENAMYQVVASSSEAKARIKSFLERRRDGAKAT